MIKINGNDIMNNYDFDNLIKNKKVFIFDFDGTIADTEPLHWRAYNELLRQFNVILLDKDIDKYIGHSEPQIYTMIKNDFSIDFDEEKFLNKRLKIYLNLVEKENLKPYQFMNKILNSYNIEHKFILVTSQLKDIVDKMLSKWEIDSYFTQKYRFFCSNGIIKKNDIYLDITRYINMSNIDYKDIVIFEDSEYYLNKAKELGMTTVGIEHRYNIGKLKSCDLILTKDE